MSHAVKIDSALEPLIEKFIDTTRADLAKLSDFIAAHDAKGAAAIGHMLKGTCGSYGFAVMAEHSQTIEVLAKSADWEGLREECDFLYRYLDEVQIQYIDDLED